MKQVCIPTSAVALAIALVCFCGAAERAQDTGSLSIEEQGYVFAGGKYVAVNGRQTMTGQIYAEYQIPTRKTHPYPIVMVHGAFQSGTNFTGTPDGRTGWAEFFEQQGYAVYVVDQPGRGKAAYVPDYGPVGQVDAKTVQQKFTTIESYNLWPQAHLHTQWPGKGVPGDPIFDQFYASQLPSINDFAVQQVLNRDAILALLERIGPSILLTHSQSGAFGWPVADARPDLVKAVVAVEPSGPPFFDLDDLGPPDWFRDRPKEGRSWGLSGDPLTYLPAAANSSDLAIVQQEKPDAPDLSRCWMQKEPARQLPQLQKMPILIVTSEASYHAPYDHCTVKYMEQAGVHPTWIKLADVGIHGNGHMMMLEKNNLEIAAVMSRWLADALPVAQGKAP